MTKILLVEDDKSLREIYGVRLLAEGYDIVSAGDGEEALAMAIKERPSLIVSDVMMPKISGFDMLDILRSTTETKDIKVIMMTALSSEDQRQRGEKLGADRYLVKSQVGIEDVVRTVHEVLGDLPGISAAPTAPQPAPTMQPAPQPTPAPASPQADTLTSTSPLPQSAPASPQPLPQPTAPFSSAVPRPNNLGDRVIQPLQNSNSTPTDVSKMMERELSDELNIGSQPHAPLPQPAPQQPQVARPDVASLSPQPQPAPTSAPQPTQEISHQPPAPAPQPSPVAQQTPPTPQPMNPVPQSVSPPAPAPQPSPLSQPPLPPTPPAA